jgi:CD109 antigen
MGSTWLTSYVAKSFMKASKYIPVDEKHITEALDFLSNVQAADGSFPEVGQVFHTDMQGGSSKGTYSLSEIYLNLTIFFLS